METTGEMASEVRKVRLEVYLNGAFHSANSYCVLDNMDEQLEFEIYDLLDHSSSQEIDVKLKVITDDPVSIYFCNLAEMKVQLEVQGNDISVHEVEDLQLKMNRNVSAGPSVEEASDQGGLDAAENNSPAAFRCQMYMKMSAGFQKTTLNAVEEPEDLVGIGQPCIPEPKVDLVGSQDPCVCQTEHTKEMTFVTGLKMTEKVGQGNLRTVKKIMLCTKPEPEEDLVPSPKHEWDQVDSVELCAPGPSHLEPHPEEDRIVPEPEPVMDWVETEQSCVPDPSVPEPEPAGPLVEVTIDQCGLDAEKTSSPREHTTKRKTKKLKKIFQRFCAVFQRKTQKPEVDLLKPDQLFISDPTAPESEPETDLVGIEQPSIPEPKVNLVGSQDSCVSQTEHTKELMTEKVGHENVRTVKKITSCIRKPEPEEDLVPSPKHEWDQVDSVELCAPGPSHLEPHPEEDSFDKDLDEPPEREWGEVDSLELYWTPLPDWDIPDKPSDPQTVLLSMLEHYVPENVSQLEDRLKRCRVRKQRPVNLVCPMVYIGDEEIVNDQEELRHLCVTHILNAAAPKKKLKHFFGKKPAEDTEGTVNTGSRNYNGWRIKYRAMPTTERHCSDISKCFKPAAKYIKKALKQRNGQVLVCCKDGENHSATLVLAYLMIYHHMLLEDAIDNVIEVRRIMPSRDFLEKLLVLNAELVVKRKRKLQDVIAGKKKRKWLPTRKTSAYAPNNL